MPLLPASSGPVPMKSPMEKEACKRWDQQVGEGRIDAAFKAMAVHAGSAFMANWVQEHRAAFVYPQSNILYHAAKGAGNEALCAAIEAVWDEDLTTDTLRTLNRLQRGHEQDGVKTPAIEIMRRKMVPDYGTRMPEMPYLIAYQAEIKRLAPPAAGLILPGR